MRVCDHVACHFFPCSDVHHEGYRVPEIDVDPERVRVILISEAAAPSPEDDYYAGDSALFARTTVQAFQEAGADVSSMRDILDLGIYLTTAIKCSKMSYNIHPETVNECSLLLEAEINLFPNVQAYLLMGDVAIRGINRIAFRRGYGRAVPAGATYKIRDGEYFCRGRRVFPSYLQAGPAFNIEQSKRRMIAEDIAAALELAGIGTTAEV